MGKIVFNAVVGEEMRELDALVFEKLFDNKQPEGAVYLTVDGVTIELPPLYSSSIRHAWMVVETMRTRGFLVRVEDWDDFWEAEFAGPKGAKLKDVKGGFSEANTAPEAICRAALEAVNE